MAGSSGADLRAPVFNGENFDFWQIRMKTIFRSHELWDIVENGVETSTKKDEELNVAESKLLKENIVRDAKALGIIQSAVSDQIFPRIAIQETANAAWNVLKQEFVGDKQVRAVKLQGLRRDFEYTRMGENEVFSAYLVRLFDLISQMRSYGEEINVVAILKGYEQRIDRHDESHTEKAFVSLSIAPKQNKYNGNQGFKPQKNWKSKWKKGDHRPANQTGKVAGTSEGAKNPCIHCDKLHFGECWFKDKPRCHSCHKLGHIARDCRVKKEKANQHVNFVNQVNDTPTMFYVCNNVKVKENEDIWYVDSGCSNHMTGREELLIDIDRNMTAKVEMGTGQLIEVTGKGSLVVDTKMGRRYIKEVMLIPGLKENLLSVGQMMEHGYFLVFGGTTAEIYDDSSMSNLIARIPMKGNRSFPLRLIPEMQVALKTSVFQSSKIWHRRMCYWEALQRCISKGSIMEGHTTSGTHSL
ncbi:unnamed protein product [Malus baccata var. baccata]